RHAVQTDFARRNRAAHETIQRLTQSLRARWERTQAKWKERSLTRRRVLVAEFAENYDDLTDLLCDSAREGVTAQDEARYAEMRRLPLRHYRALRDGFLPHWADEPNAADPFEALFGPERLADVVNAEDGIESMMRSRCALETYRDAIETRSA